MHFLYERLARISAFCLAVRVSRRCREQKPLGVIVRRAFCHRLGGSRLDDLASIHYSYPMAYVPYYCKIVRDEQVSGLRAALDLDEEIQHPRLGCEIQGRHRFVADDQARLQCERPRDRDALSLPSAELLRIPRTSVAGKPDPIEQLQHALARAPSINALGDDRLGEDVGDLKGWIERRIRILEDDLDIAGKSSPLPGSQASDVAAVERDRTAARLRQPKHRAADRRLSGAGLPHKTQGLSSSNLQRYALEDLWHRPPEPPSAVSEVQVLHSK